METIQKNWQRYFTAASLEIGWSWASLIIAAAAPVSASEFSSPELRKALFSYLDRAPLDQIRVLRKSITIDGKAHTHLPLPKWRYTIIVAMWQQDMAAIEGQISEGRYDQAILIFEQLVEIPAEAPWMKYSIAKFIVRIAKKIGGLERQHFNVPRADTDIMVETASFQEFESVIPNTKGATNFMSNLVALLGESGIYEDMLIFIIQAIMRLCWWPTWRKMEWTWVYYKPQMKMVAILIFGASERYPAGAYEHLIALIQGYTFPKKKADRSNDIPF